MKKSNSHLDTLRNVNKIEVGQEVSVANERIVIINKGKKKRITHM
jgi:hypothetical protein